MIEKSTFKYLKDLGKNNQREWFQEHKGRFENAKENFKAFTENLLNEVSKHDEIEDTKIYRIYRDVRFSKDKTPYKNSLSGHFTRATKWLRGGYYFHIQPGNSFIAGGFWNPNPADMLRIRKEIASDHKVLEKILNTARFKKTFGEMEGNQLKTAPKGFPKDHVAIKLLRYKQYILVKRFDDKTVADPKFFKEASKAFKEMRPFLNYMSDVLTTDENGVRID